MTFSDQSKNVWVALQGHVRTRDDRQRIAALWNVGAGSYFEGKDDPKVHVLESTVGYGEWWESLSGVLGRAVTLASAALGKQVGDQGPVVPQQPRPNSQASSRRSNARPHRVAPRHARTLDSTAALVRAAARGRTQRPAGHPPLSLEPAGQRTV